jgi:hypothetical protein
MSAKNTDSFLRAAKPTEGQAWAHVLCAVFCPEVTFSDVVHLRLVEGISTIPRARWSAVRAPPPAARNGNSYILQRCTLCGEAGGAVIRCSDCIREYHISCAWRNGHRFGFEIQPASVAPLFTTATLTHTTVPPPSRSGIIVVTPLRPRSKARRATWSPSSVVKNMTRASACCSTCARRTKLAR